MAAIQSIRFYMLYFVGFAVVVSLVLDRGGRVLTGVYKQVFLVLVAVGLFVMLGLADSTEVQHQLLHSRTGLFLPARHGRYGTLRVRRRRRHLHAGRRPRLSAGRRRLPALGARSLGSSPRCDPLLAAPETILWWFLFPATVRGILLAVRTRFSETSALLIFSFTLTGAYSLIHGNVGIGVPPAHPDPGVLVHLLRGRDLRQTTQEEPATTRASSSRGPRRTWAASRSSYRRQSAGADQPADAQSRVKPSMPTT